MNSTYIKFLLITLITLAFLYFMQADKLIIDEGPHINQIKSLMSGDEKHWPNITTFLLFHKIYAFLGEIFGLSKPLDFRLFSFGFTGLLIIVLMIVSKNYDKSFDWLLAAQLFFLPIALPYYPLIYTDILALILMYLAYYQFYLKQHWYAALFATIAVIIRQPSLVWLGFFLAIAFFQNLNQDAIKLRLSGVYQATLKSLPYIISLLGFLIYFYMSGGISFGDKSSHQIGINITNLYFMIVVFLLVFLPLLISRWKAVISVLKQHRWIVLLLLIGLPVYLNTFAVIHPYNKPILNNFLRNWLINHINENLWFLLIAYASSTYTILALSTIKLKSTAYNWLYLFLPLSVIAIPLIEQRYYIIGMAFWQLSRTFVDIKIEIIQLLWMVSFSLLLYIGVSQFWFSL